MTKRLADAAERVQRGEPAVTVPLGRPQPAERPPRDARPRDRGGYGVTPGRDQRAAGRPEGRRGDDRRARSTPRCGTCRWTRRRVSGESAIRSAATTSRPRPTRACRWPGHSRRRPKPGLIFNAHIEATRAAAVALYRDKVAIARTGKGGEGEQHPRRRRMLEFTHHTGRRVQISGRGRRDGAGQEGHAGDPSLHTHSLIPNAVFCAGGRVGSLNTKQVGRLHLRGGSVYQATLAQKLRDAGFDVVLDHRTGAARMPRVPDEIRGPVFQADEAGGVLPPSAFTPPAARSGMI